MGIGWRALPVGIALLVAGCGGGEGGPGGGGGFGGMPPTPVEAVTVQPQDLTDSFEGIGTFEAADAITVVTEIDGVVESLPFREGQDVERGMPLVRLDDDQLRAEMQRAEALRDQSQASFDRIQTVVEQGAGAPQDLDDAAADLKVAEADLAVARSRLEKATVRAPFAGMVGARRISPGAFVRSGQPIAELARIRELRVNFSAPERYVPRLRAGATVAVGTSAWPGYTVEGRILVVDPVLDPQTRSARVVALVQNLEERFRPGMSANVSTVLDQRSGTLTVPNEAILVEGTQTMVYVIGADSTVSPRPVSLGLRLAESVEIQEGLQPGEMVVRAGHQKLYPGAKVTPVESRGRGMATGTPGGGGPAPAGGQDQQRTTESAASGGGSR